VRNPGPPLVSSSFRNSTSFIVWGEDASNAVVIPVQNLDVKPGLVPVLVPGIQDFKTHGSLEQNWDQSKSLKFILINVSFLLN
jgi:hypothetical protein